MVDELNNMRSMDYETYFGQMRLSKREIKERIKKAEKLEEKLLFIFALISLYRQYSEIEWGNIEQEFKRAYTELIQSQEGIADEYLQNYINNMSRELTRATREHIDEEYYLSYDRARLISENEVNAIWNYEEFSQAKSSGKTMKRWHTMLDQSVRHNHSIIENVTIPIDEPFVVGNSLMMFPKDTSYGVEEKEIAGCRCTCEYL